MSNNAVVTTGLANYALGSTKTFAARPRINGLPWDLTLGSAVLLLLDPTNKQYSIVGSCGNGWSSANFTIIGPPGLWARAWQFTDLQGRKQISLSVAFGVVNSPEAPVAPGGGTSGTFGS